MAVNRHSVDYPTMKGVSINYANVWEAASSDAKTVYYVVRHPWQWVMDDLASGVNMKPVENPTSLPTGLLVAQQEQQQEGTTSSPSSARRYGRRTPRGRPKGSQGRGSLRLEVVDNASGQVELAVHGTSACFEGLGDKDELVRTIQRCRCEHLNLSPPSILIQWDATKDECLNILGGKLPVLKGNKSSAVAVLKEPMGSQGKGIYFVRGAEEIYEIIEDNHRRAKEEPGLLDNLIDQKGRIPSWVLQAEVAPALMIRGRRKFHIRTYLVVCERGDDEVLDMLIYSRHEVRIAGTPVDDDEGKERNPLAHITNGALSNTTERVLLSEVPELVELDMQQKVELFVAELFGKHLLPDISRRIAPPPPTAVEGLQIREFAVAGLDLMVAENLNIYLLEVNVNPAAPGPDMCSKAFSDHLRGFFRDMTNLVSMGVGESKWNFLDAFAILERQEQSSSG